MGEQRGVMPVKVQTMASNGFGWIDIVVMLDVECPEKQNRIRRQVLGNVQRRKKWSRVYRKPNRDVRERLEATRRNAREGKTRRGFTHHDPYFRDGRSGVNGVLDESESLHSELVNLYKTFKA